MILVTRFFFLENWLILKKIHMDMGEEGKEDSEEMEGDIDSEDDDENEEDKEDTAGKYDAAE